MGMALTPKKGQFAESAQRRLRLRPRPPLRPHLPPTMPRPRRLQRLEPAAPALMAQF